MDVATFSAAAVAVLVVIFFFDLVVRVHRVLLLFGIASY